MPLGLPSPGQFVGAVGSVMQAAENFVSGAVNTAVDAIQDFASESPAPTTTLYTAGGGVAQVQGTVSAQDFQDFQNLVARGFDAVRSDIAAIRAYGAANDGNGGMLDGYSSGNGSNDNTLMLLLLAGGLGGTTSTLTTNPLLLLLLLGNGNSDFGLPMMLALGLI